MRYTEKLIRKIIRPVYAHQIAIKSLKGCFWGVPKSWNVCRTYNVVLYWWAFMVNKAIKQVVLTVWPILVYTGSHRGNGNTFSTSIKGEVRLGRNRLASEVHLDRWHMSLVLICKCDQGLVFKKKYTVR